MEAPLKDAFETAVILEALGYSDHDAQGFGYSDLFGFAEAIKRVAGPYAGQLPSDPAVARQRISRLSGFFGNLGWMLVLIALFVGGHSLWAARDVSAEAGAAMGLGVVLGLAVGGGIQQVASWKISYYYLQGNLPLVRFVMRRLVVVGIGLLIATATAAFLIAADGFPASVAALSAAYALLVGGYRLAIAPLIGLNRMKSVFTVTALGLAGMFAAYTLLSDLGVERLMAVLLSQLVGVTLISVLSGVTLGVLVGGLRLRPAPPVDAFHIQTQVLRRVQPPRFWALLFDSLPQFLFGTWFFLFLFGDRLVLWISAVARTSGYNAGYQIGVDSALLMIVPISAIHVPLFMRLSERLDDLALRTRCYDRQGFARSIGQAYSALVMRVSIPAAAICAIALLLADQIIDAVGGDGTSVRVFRTAIIGMFMFSLFLSNAALLAIFRRTALTGALLLVAAIMNIVLTSVFASLIAPAAAVLGFLLSSLFLAVASLISIARMSRRADHAYYAAV